MTIQTLRIERGQVYRVKVEKSSTTSLGCAKIWVLNKSSQDTFFATLGVDGEKILGPYINITEFRIETMGNVSVALLAEDFSIPYKTSDVGGFRLEGVLVPEDFGCKGEYKASSNGNYDGTYFYDTYFKFEQKHIGWTFWEDVNARTVKGVTADGKAIIEPAPYGTNYINWRIRGQDDTPFMQKCFNAASPDYTTDPTYTYPETYIGLNGPLKFGKVVLLTPGVVYPVTLSQTDYNAGNTKALTARRRTAITCLTMGEHGATIAMVPGSYGDIMTNNSPTSQSDFIKLSNFTLHGDGDFNPNCRDGLRWEIPTDFYDKVDPYHRFENIRVERIKRNGVFYSGKGELKVRDVDAFNCGGIGCFYQNSYDTSVIGGQFGANGKTGLMVDQPGPIQITGIKSFFNGSAGEANDEDSANIVLTSSFGDAHSGGGFLTNFQSQESHGCGVIVKIRNCKIEGSIQDPNRSTVGSGTRPTVKAGIYLKGPNACGNKLDIMVMAALTEYATPNWPAGTCVLAIDGDSPFSTANGGPQNNYGAIEYPVTFITPGNGTLLGLTFTGGGAALYDAAGQKGCVNGKNTRLTVNGVALT